MRERWLLIGVAAATLGVSGLAQAQACEEGRIQVEGGYCCWPGQAIDEATGRCMGPPTCPADRAASGAECVARAPTSLAIAASTTAPEPANVMDEGFVIAGATLVGLGYLAAVITSLVVAPATSYQRPCTGCSRVPVQAVAYWPVGFVPLFHALGAVDSHEGWGGAMAGVGIGSAALEIAGAVLLALGVVGHPARDPSLAIGAWRLGLGAPDADAGLSLELSL